MRSMKQDYTRILRDIEAQRAQVQLAQTSYDRQLSLVRIGGTSRSRMSIRPRPLCKRRNPNRDRLQQQAAVQLAKLGGQIRHPVEQHPEYLQAKAARDEAQRQLDHTVVKAPFDGTVTQVSSLQPGAMIVSSMAAFMPTSAVGLVGDTGKWVEANLKETDLTYVHPGQPVTMTIDSFPDRVWHGKRHRHRACDWCAILGSAFREFERKLGQGRAAACRSHRIRSKVEDLSAAPRGHERHPKSIPVTSASFPICCREFCPLRLRRANQHAPPFADHGMHHDRDPDAGARQHDRECCAAAYAGQPAARAATRLPGC